MHQLPSSAYIFDFFDIINIYYIIYMYIKINKNYFSFFQEKKKYHLFEFKLINHTFKEACDDHLISIDSIDYF
jgi:hypothetical protein